jgi:hypothetical protein
MPDSTTAPTKRYAEVVRRAEESQREAFQR